jgi:hypothetical protein
MEKERKRITITVSPTLILLAVLILCILWTLVRLPRVEDKTLKIDDTAVLVDRVRTLGELTTAVYYDEIVLQGSKQNYFSTTPLGAIARDNFGKDVDDHLVIIAKGTVRAGVDLLEMTEEDIRFVKDTVYLRLPEARYLDVIANPSDFEVFAESGNWTHDQITRIQDSARDRLVQGADHYGLKQKAYDGAMDAVTTLLEAAGYIYVRFDHRPSYIKLPPLKD